MSSLAVFPSEVMEGQQVKVLKEKGCQLRVP
jgi:hypothetical protein